MLKLIFLIKILTHTSRQCTWKADMTQTLTTTKNSHKEVKNVSGTGSGRN